MECSRRNVKRKGMRGGRKRFQLTDNIKINERYDLTKRYAEEG